MMRWDRGIFVGSGVFMEMMAFQDWMNKGLWGILKIVAPYLLETSLDIPTNTWDYMGYTRIIHDYTPLPMISC